MEKNRPVIGSHAPVRGYDLDRLRVKLNLTVSDFCWIFGLPMHAWSQIKQHADQPVNDPSMAILARILDERPDLSPVPPRTKAVELYNELIEHADRTIPKKEIGIALGREASAGYRWITQGGRTPPVLSRLFLIAIQELQRVGIGAWDDVKRVAEIESRARGIDNIWESGNWDPDRAANAASQAESAGADQAPALPAEDDDGVS